MRATTVTESTWNFKESNNQESVAFLENTTSYINY